MNEAMSWPVFIPQVYLHTVIWRLDWGWRCTPWWFPHMTGGLVLAAGWGNTYRGSLSLSTWPSSQVSMSIPWLVAGFLLHPSPKRTNDPSQQEGSYVPLRPGFRSHTLTVRCNLCHTGPSWYSVGRYYTGVNTRRWNHWGPSLNPDILYLWFSNTLSPREEWVRPDLPTAFHNVPPGPLDWGDFWNKNPKSKLIFYLILSQTLWNRWYIYHPHFTVLDTEA